DELEKILQNTEQAIRKGTIGERLETTDSAIRTGETYPQEMDFHRAVALAAGNVRLSSEIREISTQVRLARARVGREPEWVSLDFAEHAEVLAAIKNRDPLAAGLAMERHLANSTD